MSKENKSGDPKSGDEPCSSQSVMSSSNSSVETTPCESRRLVNRNSLFRHHSTSSEHLPVAEHEPAGADAPECSRNAETESKSERQSRLARQRLLNEVFQENGELFGHEDLGELEFNNILRVYADGDDSTEPRRNVNAANRDLTPRVEAMIANYMVRKYAADASNHSMNANQEEQNNEDYSLEDRPAVNILPASRHLEFPMNSLIAFGRKPSPAVNKPARVANAAESNPLGWQASKTTLKERVSFMFANDILADVFFLVGREDNRQRIPAHKFVLSIGSVVFDAMFNGGLTPQNSKDPLEIELPDVEPSAFLTLLKFLYTDEVNIGPESVMTTLYTAKKYAVPAMESTCVEFLEQNLGADNAFLLLTQARLFDEPQLEQLCLDRIDEKTFEALNGEGFTEIDHTTLCMVLSRDTLRVREAMLFQAVVRWANEECVRRGLAQDAESRRTVLGNAIKLIRFPLMTVEEFAQTAAQSGLLMDKDVVNLFLYFTVNPKPSSGFNDRPRSAVAGKELVVGRFQRNEMRWGYSGTADRVKFTVDKKIYVIGFGLYGSIQGQHEYPVSIEIVHCGTGKVIAQNETSFCCDGSSGTFRVLFNDPVEITPGVTYTASALLRGPDTYYGTKGLRRVVYNSSAENVVTFQFTFAAGHNNGTSVEDGQIPEIIFYTQLN